MDPNERIAALEAKRNQLTARLTRLRNAEASKERNRRTRRLILMGTYAESKMREDPETEARFMAALDGFLTRKRDRELFGLAPLPEDTG